MNSIIYILLAIAFTICFISLFAYFSITKLLKTKREKFGINSIERNTTIYQKILNELGTIENIEEVNNEKITVLSSQLVNLNNLKSLKIKVEIEGKILTLTSKEFSIKLFIKKLKEELKK
ncbi:hypothetical protein [Spiroplasma diminutum]|uniref:PTS EIIB type-1 domain-containing protein n=1 Tax=Spiroplasma diminutum CUAS-1 TaxID=1276221 RepID=S5M1I3_9MOLU|nr:hypothetical protein [Spiroplasma diminutum]AGR41912.1 hypothetical protein SDIMI_v3c02080 [Spiroplasma diminutum CUAS-1]